MIGVFDSGLGGLTVVRELQRQLPGFPIVYFGDTARTPYGTKGADTVAQFAVQDAKFLESQGAEIIVVACNTASAVAMPALKKATKLPIFEVVSPAVTHAARLTKGKVGVVGTRATIGSGVYERKMKEIAPDVRVYVQACPLFVPLVEEGWHRSAEAKTIAESYLKELRLRSIDTLILGCTHYPFLKTVIREVAGEGVSLVDPARETVAELKRYITTRPDLMARLCSRKGNRFFVSDRTGQFGEIAARWLGQRKVALKEAKME